MLNTFLYTGRFETPTEEDWESWIQLYDASKHFEIQGLSQSCENYLRESLDAGEAFHKALDESVKMKLQHGISLLVELINQHHNVKYFT